MNTDDVKEVSNRTKTLCIIGAVIILWLVVFGIYKAMMQVYDLYIQEAYESHVVPDYIKMQMKRLGTQVLFEDWKGEIYFYINGKKAQVRR